MAAAAMLVTAACGSSGAQLPTGGAGGVADDSATAAADVTALPLEPPGSADVAFAQMMVPHHRQALELSLMAQDPARGADPGVRDLADQVAAESPTEMALMSQWLTTWNMPEQMANADAAGIPGEDHSGHDMGGMTMAGMLTEPQLANLAKLNGAAFDRQWLTLMTENSKGAIAMAEQVRVISSNPQVVALADQLVAEQSARIGQLQQQLASTPSD